MENDNKKDTFSVWLRSDLLTEKDKLNDLLGTKYIRQNNLVKAAETFKKIDFMYWNNNYSLWNESYYSLGKIFDKNPFYTLEYTPDFIKKKENFYLTKLSVTTKLIDYLARANDSAEENRDLYYFLVANCYKNMTISGNSWMMRRFGFSSYDVEPFPVDQVEFTKGLMAKKYYKLAGTYSQNLKFKSLCLWLAKDFKQVKKYAGNDIYMKLKSSNCYAFKEFFEARR